jgi:hypothetical protein
MPAGRGGVEAAARNCAGPMTESSQKKGPIPWSRPQRYAFRATLEIEWGSSIMRGVTRDISSNGMFIEADSPLWVGAGFTARIKVDQSAPVKVDCAVKRVEPGHGMGVTITPSGPDSEKFFQQLIAALSKPKP